MMLAPCPTRWQRYEAARASGESDNLACTAESSEIWGAHPAYRDARCVCLAIIEGISSKKGRDQALVANAVDGMVEGIALSSLDTTEKRDDAYCNRSRQGGAALVPLAGREKTARTHPL
ncbi:MAG: hypothetical protein M9908_07900 [Phyllobacteriaceae bacterium]|nr:hypothetical protein [Phyllobacteriaceae bacterium]